MNNLILADLLLFLVTIGWGLTYLMTKTLVKEIPPFTILWVRFSLASFIYILIFFKKLEFVTQKFLFRSIFCGFILWLAFVMQIYGIQTSSPGKAGVITGLFIIFVPILYFILEKKSLSYVTISASFISFLGLYLFSNQKEGSLTINQGDYILIFSAFFYALHIIYIDKTYEDFEKVNVYMFILIQIFILTFLSLIPALFLESFPHEISTNSRLGLLYNIFVGTILAYSVQFVVQKYSPPTHVSLIMSFESVSAYFFSWLFYDEPISLKSILGAFLILMGIFITGISEKKNVKS